MNLARVLLPAHANPFASDQTMVMPWSRGEWRARWIRHPDQGPGVGGVAWYRRHFAWGGGELRLHVSADQRFRLFLDGTDLGGGPERGDLAHWRYHSWAGDLPAGEHVLQARVWWLADAPHAQCSIRPAFLCAGDGAAANLLDSGHAPWEVRLEDCWEPLPKGPCWGVGARVRLRLDGGLSDADGGAASWRTPTAHDAALHEGAGACNRGQRLRLVPARLPPQKEWRGAGGQVRLVADARSWSLAELEQRALDPADHLPGEAAAWQSVIDGHGMLRLPAGVRRRVLIDLGDYRCAYPEITLAGHGTVRVSWAEACFTRDRGELKGRRDQWAGHFFRGVADEFVAASPEPRPGATLWWESGRFVELTVSADAGADGLVIHALGWRETGYPLVEEGRFASSDAPLQASLPLMLRSLERCAHETFMDCPYYEQLQYIGDTRLECQVTRAIGRDHRLCIQALDNFAHSLRDEGRLSSRRPTWEWQDIPTFSLLWIGMLHDALHWGGDAEVVRRHLGTMRTVLETFRARLRPDGLLGWVQGWNFMDWVPGWPAGEVPGENQVGGGGPNSWLLAYVANLAAEIEEWAGEPTLAARDRALAEGLARACVRHLWDEPSGCFADTAGRRTWSEHAQLLALLAGVEPQRGIRLLDCLERSATGAAQGSGYDFSPAALAGTKTDYAHPGHLAQSTVYFSHYRFEAAARFRRPNLLFNRLDYWRGLSALGFSTVPEMPEPSRSDCHAWGSHPRFHVAASILGIRPAAPLFAAVRIAPMLGPLEWAEGSWPHPLGDIAVRLRRVDGAVHGEVELPAGLPGELAIDGQPKRAFSGRVAW
jgi:hypothetical protein